MIHGVEVVEVPIPRGRVEEARNFYGAVLGLRELNRSTSLSRDAAVHFALPDGRELQLGTVDDFRPLRKSHPTFEAKDLEALSDVLGRAGHRTEWDFSTARATFFCRDPFGNHLQFVLENT